MNDWGPISGDSVWVKITCSCLYCACYVDKQNLRSPGLSIWPLSKTHKRLIPVPGKLIGIIQLTLGQIQFPQLARCTPHSKICCVGSLIWKASVCVHKCNTIVYFCSANCCKAIKCPVLFWELWLLSVLEGWALTEYKTWIKFFVLERIRHNLKILVLSTPSTSSFVKYWY